MKDLKAAREFCFQYFFHLQLPVFHSIRQELRADSSSLLQQSLKDFRESTNTMLSFQAEKFVQEQIASTLGHYEQIENIISEHLKNWKLSRLSKVDHTNLLLSVNDLCFSQSASLNIIINEAVEISKKFGSKESAAFINGVLDSVAKNNLNVHE